MFETISARFYRLAKQEIEKRARNRSRSMRRAERTQYKRHLTAELLEERCMLSVTVTTLADELFNGGNLAAESADGNGLSLREAIGVAPSGETIDFAPSLISGGPATINLSHGELLINKNLTINGPGAQLLTIDGSGNDPTPAINNGDGLMVLNIDDGNQSTLASVAILRVTITGGDTAAGITGAGIDSLENLSLTSVAVVGNSATARGGGIYSGAGSLTINDSSISGNSSRSSGGGIFASNLTLTDSTVSDNSGTSGAGIVINPIQNPNAGSTITNSAISSNHSSGDGGGIILITVGGSGQTMTISGTTVANNTAASNGGGILAAFDGAGQISITASTISSNSAAKGGGIYEYESAGPSKGDLRIENSTVSNNSANAGGGLYLRPLTKQFVDIRSVTITQNKSSMGGGINGNDHVDLKNTIISGNATADGASPDNIFGTMNQESSYNLVGTNGDGGLSPVLGNLLGINNPQLGPLANSGGLTSTHSPLIGSPAIDAGDPKHFYSPSEFDQRGNPSARLLNGRIDIGAVESPGPIISVPITSGIDLSQFVPNLNFEAFNNLPTGYSQMAIAGQTVTAWSQLTSATSDYMHVGSFMGNTSVALGGVGVAPIPTNGSGGFTGVINDNSQAPPNGYHEYVVNVLPAPLAPGVRYQLDLFAGTTSIGGVYGGGFVGQLVVYGLIDASKISTYMGGNSSAIENFAQGNVVELLAVDVDQPASTWTSFRYQTFTPSVPIQAIVLGAKTSRPNTYLLMDAAASSFPVGDYNRNGVVDAADYTVWRDTLGSAVTPSHGADGDGDGTVDQDDYNIWKANFGQTFASGGGAGSLVSGDYNRANVELTGDFGNEEPNAGSMAGLETVSGNNGIDELRTGAILEAPDGGSPRTIKSLRLFGNDSGGVATRFAWDNRNDLVTPHTTMLKRGDQMRSINDKPKTGCTDVAVMRDIFDGQAFRCEGLDFASAVDSSASLDALDLAIMELYGPQRLEFKMI